MATKRTVERKTAIRNSVGRIIIFGLFVLAQIIGFIVLLYFIGDKFPPIDIVVRALALIVALGINSRDHNSAFKLIWVIAILILPVPGLLFYVLNNFSSSKHKIKKRLEKVDLMVFSHLNYNDDIFDEFRKKDPARASNAKYLRRYDFPIYEGTDIQYFPVAYDCYKDQIEAIKKAEKFVYLEYHAIETKEAFEASFESELDGFAAAFEWKMAVEDMVNHMDELTPEQVDSFKMIIANVQQTIDELEADENAAVEVESEDSVETEEAIESEE